jgi:hypothetical protein
MTRMLVGDKELEVEEDLDLVWTRINNSRDGVTQGGVRITAPGWIIVTAPALEGPVYVQASNIGYVRP